MMGGESRLQASEDEKRALVALSTSPDRAEADRARAIILTLAGWTSGRIAQAFGVREDTVRLWRSDFMRGGVSALKTRRPPGAAPVKAEAALSVAEDLLSAPLADRTNWTLPRLASEIERRTGERISSSRLSVVLRKKGLSAGAGRVTP
jgi:transposase